MRHPILKTLGLGLVVLAVAALPVALAVATDAPRRHVVHVGDAWALACKLEQVDCSKIPMPKIEGAHLFHDYGAFGAFFGEAGDKHDDTVYVDDQLGPMLDDTLLESVVAHEMTHYIDYQTKGVEWMKAHSCDTEFNGWRVGNAYLVIHGRPDLADYTWQERYGCFGASDE